MEDAWRGLLVELMMAGAKTKKNLHVAAHDVCMSVGH